MFDLTHPFFKPRWIQVVLVVFTGAWAVLEFSTNNPLWGVLFAAMSIWCGWSFFIKYIHGGLGVGVDEDRVDD